MLKRHAPQLKNLRGLGSEKALGGEGMENKKEKIIKNKIGEDPHITHGQRQEHGLRWTKYIYKTGKRRKRYEQKRGKTKNLREKRKGVKEEDQPLETFQLEKFGT